MLLDNAVMFAGRVVNGADHRFVFAGVIVTARQFDRERQREYSITVTATDWAEEPLIGISYVRVFISDVNDNKPVFAQRLYEVGVDENADVGLAVVTVSANDEDEGMLDEAAERGGPAEISLIIRARKGGQRGAEITGIMRSTETCCGLCCLSLLHIPNNAGFFSSFVIAATGANAKLRYQITSGNKGGVFDIEPEVGTIFIAQPLDYEQQKRYKLLVLGLTGFTDVIINVWDINDNAPTFSCAPDNCHSSIAENSPPGTFVVEMTAVDLDDAAVGQNAILTYRITENTHNADSADLFTIDSSTGTISVSAEGLDRELADSHHLIVEARDGGGMTGTATVTVVVTDINDHVPKFREDWCGARVPESTDEDAAILELSATDPDAGTYGHLTFSVVAGDPEQRFYMVSHRLEQTGALRLKKQLDFEQPGEQRFNLTIKVEDSDFSSLIHCLVLVEDENDNAPVFTPSSHLLSPLPEDISVGSSIVQVVATDTDSGQNGDILYSILPQSDPYGHFTVSRGGVVTVARPLDRETVASYELVVMATDRGTPALTGSVTVHLPLLDMNDNGPELETAYTPVLWENSPAPQVVWLNSSSTLLHVVDRDSPEHGPPFSLALPSVYSTDFHLQDHGNGSATLTTLRRFDRERQTEFRLPVVMTDSGVPPITATSTDQCSYIKRYARELEGVAITGLFICPFYSHTNFLSVCCLVLSCLFVSVSVFHVFIVRMQKHLC
uniref:Cadherin domain-containing protein n=1 Tax=Stegastes partitus TaxID=144197 RepID=A0A3B4ZZX9_9TELE